MPSGVVPVAERREGECLHYSTVCGYKEPDVIQSVIQQQYPSHSPGMHSCTLLLDNVVNHRRSNINMPNADSGFSVYRWLLVCTLPAATCHCLPPSSCCTPPYLHLATSEMWCWSGGGEYWKKTVSVLQYCVTILWWCTNVRAVLTGRSTVSGFVLLGLALCFLSASVSLVFMALYRY